MLAIPLAVWTSRRGVGDTLGRAGLLVTPAERATAPELRACQAYAQRAAPVPDLAHLVTCPKACALHMAVIGLAHGRRRNAAGHALRAALVARVAAGGPDSADATERKLILRDAHVLSSLHDAVWTAPPAHAARWGIATPGELQAA